MNLKERLTENWSGARIAALLSVLVGLLLWRLPEGEPLARWSYDLLVVLGGTRSPQEVVVIKMDEQSYDELKQRYPGTKYWDRRIHARLMERLTQDGAKLVVFDVLFSQSEPRPQEDDALASALQANGRVILAGEYSPLSGHTGFTVYPPLEILKTNARAWGLTLVEPDTDLVIRKHSPGTEDYKSLPWAAAAGLEAPGTKEAEGRFRERWMLYYGPEGTLPSLSYYLALQKPLGFYKDKIVFIGGKPHTRNVGEETDEFASPYTHLGGPFMAGVEINATTFLNLLHGEWLTRMPAGLQLLSLLSCGLFFGLGLALMRPLRGAGVALAGALGVGLLACLLFWYQRIWFPWLLIAGAQIPCAWLCGLVWHTQKLQRMNKVLEGKLGDANTTALPDRTTAGTAGEILPQVQGENSATITLSESLRPPVIPDHELLRRVGKGTYGEVFLARNAVGLLHAVKIVSRGNFDNPEPYDREFRGIQKYMPISRNHPGLVNVLHVGRNDSAGYFYYVMELADGEAGQGKVDPETYVARNLAGELKKQRRLPLLDCVQLGLSLSSALHYLHQERLVHRDIKPANIIFVRQQPKIADIGLVREMTREGSDVTQVGTRGYMAPEGPGTPMADIYSLGMVLYEAMTGLDRHRYPTFPEDFLQPTEVQAYTSLKNIVLKACQWHPEERYATAELMNKDLGELHSQF